MKQARNNTETTLITMKNTETKQKPLLSDYIKAFDYALTPEKCEEIIKRFEGARPNEHRTDLYSFDQIICNEENGFEDIAELYATRALEVATEYFNALGLSIVPEVEAFEFVRIKRYIPGRDDFKEHVDVADHDSARRYLVCMTYLSDNEAGHTTFDGLGVSIECKQGRMSVFPPMWMFPHAGTAPINTPKYTICTLLHYL